MLRGHFEHAVDEKGRVAVPAPFRSHLAERAVVSVGAEGRLVIWPTAAWETHLGNLNISAGSPPEQRMYLRRINADSFDVELDPQGRLLIPPALRKFASIRERAFFVGMGEYVELCATERWEGEGREVTPEAFTELADRINPMGFITRPPAPS
jgi:MraZ protein